MKLTGILFFLLLLNRQSIAQSSEFAPIGAKWWYGFAWNGMDFEQMYYYLESKQDTILFGQECKRLESKILYPFSEEKVADIFVYQSGDTVFYAIDSLAGELMDTSFHILYNFAAVPGDVWPLGIGDYLGYEDIICGVEPEAYVIVDSVNVETIAGLTLKKSSFHSESYWGYWDFAREAYEIFGNKEYLFPYSGCYVKDPFPNYLNCYEDPNIGLIQFSPYGCAEFSEVITVSNELSLYPMPFSSYFNLKSDAKIAQISIYGIDGVELYSANNVYATTVNINSKVKGVLLMKLIYENNKISYVNIVKV